MKKRSFLVKHVLMSTLTAIAFAFGFTSCSDEFEPEQVSGAPEAEDVTALTRASVEDYNINDSVKDIKDRFTKDNWETQNAIYLRVSNNAYANPNIQDTKKRTGYSVEHLPWSKESVESHLPNGFLKDFTRDNGWELVANYCGDYYQPNANYIVFYNKYLGKMRYFYFMPRGASLNSSQDHNWEILMQDGAADHSVFGYAVPVNRKITNRRAIKAEQGGYWSQIVTPWNSTTNKFGQQAPLVGWYAFDVDLSVYRGKNVATLQDDNCIKPTLRGYAQDNVKLYGKLNADITGSIDMEKCCVNSQSGVFGPFEQILGQAGEVKDFFCKAKDIYASATSGDFLGVFESGIAMAKQGCDLMGIDYGATSEGFNGFKGDVNLRLEGTVDFEGMIQKATVIEGTSSIEQRTSKYDFREDLHMGEGIWNISDAPVVYYTDAFVKWNHSDDTDGSYQDIKSPFGGNTTEVKNPYRGRVCYFDPSSIKLELNPNVFSPKEIASAKVYATCGVRKDAKFLSTEAYRTAQGLHSSKVSETGQYKTYFNQPTNRAPFDALLGHKDASKSKFEAGQKFDVETANGSKYGLYGRGDDNYLIDPLTLTTSGSDETLLPAYEVTVTVMVMRDNKQMVFTRTYLPEYKFMEASNLSKYASPSCYFGKPAHYVKEVYDQQILHIKELYKWAYRTLQPNGIRSGNLLWYHDWGTDIRIPQSQGHASLFDNSISTVWCLHEDCRDDQGLCTIDNKGEYDSKRYTWWCNFNTNYPVAPSSYTMVTGRHGSEAPTEWAILGKQNGKWVTLDYRKGNYLPNSATSSKEFNFSKLSPKYANQKFSEFRLEIYNVRDNDEMSLCDFWFNYML